MGFRFQRRKKITDWLRINLSRSGIAPAVRTKWGSFSPKGFSLLTGIPGLTYRGGWAKRVPELGLLILLIAGLLLVVVNLCRLAWYVVVLLFQFFRHLIRK